MESGSVSCSRTPVSPVTPLKVIAVVLSGGFTIVQHVGVVPPVGQVIVFAPLASVTTCDWPGLSSFAAALCVVEATRSPVKLMSIPRVDATVTTGPSH